MANREDNYLALIRALAQVAPLGPENERSNEAADQNHSPFHSESVAVTTTPTLREIGAFGLSLDDGTFGTYLQVRFNGPSDPDVTRLYIGQTLKFPRGLQKGVWISSSVNDTLVLSWQIDRFADKRY